MQCIEKMQLISRWPRWFVARLLEELAVQDLKLFVLLLTINDLLMHAMNLISIPGMYFSLNEEPKLSISLA